MEEMVIALRLPSGHEILFDEGDEALVRQYAWHAARGRTTYYAVHSRYMGGGRAGRTGKLRMHRLVVGAGPGDVVDHINGNGLDNRRANLRICSGRQNPWNCRRYANNTSGYKGVSFYRLTGRWIAYINHLGKRIHLGYFATPETAAAAYDDAALRLFGEFARPNRPLGSPEKAPKQG